MELKKLGHGAFWDAANSQHYVVQTYEGTLGHLTTTVTAIREGRSHFCAGLTRYEHTGNQVQVTPGFDLDGFERAIGCRLDGTPTGPDVIEVESLQELAYLAAVSGLMGAVKGGR